MDRLIATNSVNLAGASVAPVSGTPQYATDGVPGVTPPTQFPAYAWNAVQEELIAAILAAGLTPDRTNLGQLAASIGRGGQCRLSLSGGNLVLKPYNGNKLFVPGTGAMAIPAAGVSVTVGATLAEGGSPAANTVYFVYAFNNAGALALQLSATTHATDANTGVEIRSGDATRALVGMARTNAAPAFVDSLTQRFVSSYFNRATKTVQNSLASASTASATNVDLMPSNHIEFLNWGDEATGLSFIGVGTNSSASSSLNTAIAVDSTTVGTTPTFQMSAPAASANIDASFGQAAFNLAEGYHFATVIGFAGSNTASWSNLNVFANIRG